jgi:tRNA (guanine37-N1)-methyltransferase
MTRSLALVVPRAEGERVRRRLRDAGALRADLRLDHDGRFLYLPVAKAPDEIPAGGRLEDHEFLPQAATGPESYREALDLPPEASAWLPRSFDVVGDIVLIRLPPEASAYEEAVGTALLRFVPGARLVGVDEGVHGSYRQRRVRRIAGAGAWSTRHKENGLAFEVDLERAYFSPRLAREHARVAESVKPGERVFDLCSGIGPFALTIARLGRARTIEAVDSNPDAIALLEENARRQGVADRVRARTARIEDALPSLGIADRIVFNLPREGIMYLPQVCAALEPGGVLHYYEMTERAAQATRSTELVKPLDRTRGAWRIERQRVVHPYSPRADLVAYDLRREAP